MLCIHFPIRKEHRWSLFPQLLPSLLDWWNWYRVSGCWTTMTTRYMHLLDTKLLLQAPSDLLGNKTTVICFKEIVVFVSTRVHSSCSYTRLPLSVSLCGSMNEFCRRWCAKASTHWPFATFTLRSPPFPPHLRPSSRCLYCYKTGKND